MAAGHVWIYTAPKIYGPWLYKSVLFTSTKPHCFFEIASLSCPTSPIAGAPKAFSSLHLLQIYTTKYLFYPSNKDVLFGTRESMLRYETGDVTICVYGVPTWISKTTLPLEVLVARWVTRYIRWETAAPNRPSRPTREQIPAALEVSLTLL